jgi:hypothetical protein
MFGCPPQFPVEEESVATTESTSDNQQPGQQALKKKGKVAAKSTGKKYQWQIMESMGVPSEDIHRFADANYWLYYFPPLAQVYLTIDVWILIITFILLLVKKMYFKNVHRLTCSVCVEIDTLSLSFTHIMFSSLLNIYLFLLAPCFPRC